MYIDQILIKFEKNLGVTSMVFVKRISKELISIVAEILRNFFIYLNIFGKMLEKFWRKFEKMKEKHRGKRKNFFLRIWNNFAEIWKILKKQ